VEAAGIPGSDTTSAGGPPQVTRIPTGGVQTGGGSTAGLENQRLIELGGLLLLAAALVAVRRRRATLALLR
jgi:MYXO-CTERM domain-containing protein